MSNCNKDIGAVVIVPVGSDSVSNQNNRTVSNYKNMMRQLFFLVDTTKNYIF